MARQRYKKLPYAALQQQLSKLRANGIAGEFPMLDAMIEQAQERMSAMYTALERIAAYHDKTANKHLEVHGTYSAFDEPSAVRLSRETLQEL